MDWLKNINLPSFTEIIALISILLVVWKTFFSPVDKKKLLADKSGAEANAIKQYEEAAALTLSRVEKLEERCNRFSLENAALKKLIDKTIKENADLKERVILLELEIVRRDAIIACLSTYYSSLAEKAQLAGVKDFDIEIPCFDLPEDFNIRDN